jgi:hypothetical protein
LLSDFPKIVKAAAAHDDRTPAWRCGDDEPARFYAHVECERTAGLSEQQIARRRRAGGMNLPRPGESP